MKRKLRELAQNDSVQQFGHIATEALIEAGTVALISILGGLGTYYASKKGYPASLPDMDDD